MQVLTQLNTEDQIEESPKTAKEPIKDKFDDVLDDKSAVKTESQNHDHFTQKRTQEINDSEHEMLVPETQIAEDSINQSPQKT